MEQKTIKFGVIGCGLMGKEFASVSARWNHLLGNIPRPVIIAACDTHEESRKWFEEKVDGLKYSVGDYKQLLDKEDIDAIYCAVPHVLHEQVYTDIIKAGKHLLGEKPFGMDLKQNGAILKCIDENPDVFVRCASQIPFYPAAQQIIRWFEAGKFGKVLEVKAGYNHSSDLDLSKPINWKRKIEMNGEYGCLGDLGIHTQHIPIRLGLIPKSVYAQLSKYVNERSGADGKMEKCETWDNATLNCNVDCDGNEIPMVLETKRMWPGATNYWYIEIYGMDFSAKFSTDDPNALFYTQEFGREQAWCRVNIGYKPQFDTITGSIFEFGTSDAIMQMWACFMKEMNGEKVEFGCFTPQETAISHCLMTAAIKSHKTKSSEILI